VKELKSEDLAALESICTVLADPVSRLAYARDLWPLGHIHFAGGDPEGLGPRPAAVACPRDEAELVELVRWAAERQVPVIPWGEGSGVCGGTVASRGGIAVDLKGLDRVVEIDRISCTATFEAGLNGRILEELLEREGFTLGHCPSSLICSSLGGWLAGRSAGQFSTLYGKIEDMVLSLRVVLPDGRIAETIAAPRAAAGPDWNQVFIGSEGTLGIITQATLRIHRRPSARRFLTAMFPTVEAGFDAIREIMQSGLRPAAVRLYDPLDTLLVGAGKDHQPVEQDPSIGREWPLNRFSPKALAEFLQHSLPHELSRLGKKTLLGMPALANAGADKIAGQSLLVLVFEGAQELVEVQTRLTEEILREHKGEDRGAELAETWWRNRFAVSFKQSEVFRMGAFSDTMEVATTWSRLPALYHGVRKALSPHAVVLAHFSHAYPEGCNIYFSMAARCASPEAAAERYRVMWRAGLDATVALGAAVSHHHGIGLLKAEALKRSLGPLHDLLQSLKTAVDPQNIMNPGKLGLA